MKTSTGLLTGPCLSLLGGHTDPLGPHPGASKDSSSTSRAGNPVATCSQTHLRPDQQREAARRCHPGVIRDGPRTSMTRSQTKPGERTPKHASNQDKGRHFPCLRTLGTPLRPSANFLVTTRYRPGSPLRSGGIDRWAWWPSVTSSDGDLNSENHRLNSVGSMRSNSRVGFYGVSEEVSHLEGDCLGHEHDDS